LLLYEKVKKIFKKETTGVKKTENLDDMNQLKDYYEERFQALQNDMELINGELVKSFEEHSNLNKDISKKLSENFKLLVGKIDIIENQLEEKNKVIKNYEEGYKYNLVKNICIDIIEVIRSMEKEKCDWDNQLNVYIFKKLNSILNENYVYAFVPSTKSKFNPKISKYINSEITDVEKLDGKVSEVIHIGYRIKVTETKYKVLRPAEVNVFKYFNKDEK
jgi:molecular chaperone GrpE (heat shock protein)